MKHAVKQIHFVGIGGAGMSGIAEVLHNLGYRITGSDQHESATTRALAKRGIQVRIGHDAAHIAGAEAVVTSSAVKGDNPEVIAARAKRVILVPGEYEIDRIASRRPELYGPLVEPIEGICDLPSGQDSV